MEELIHHISDTARWIAGYRAQETERPDAVFRDPYANRLAGERGREMVAATPNMEAMALAIVVRTCAMDRLIGMAISEGVDTIINLGAGLDARPYRMKLPQHLRWVEVDFQSVIQYKEKQLAGEKAACQLQRISADLSNNMERKNLFAKLGAETKKALILTEGVVAYLTNDQAAQLSRELYATPAFHFWIMDYSRGGFRKRQRSKKFDEMMKRTPVLFTEKDPIGFFSSHGWNVKENVFLLDEANRIGRSLPLKFPWTLLMRLFPKIRKVANKAYSFVMFVRG